jgi:hypothetical protein
VLAQIPPPLENKRPAMFPWPALILAHDCRRLAEPYVTVMPK